MTSQDSEIDVANSVEEGEETNMETIPLSNDDETSSIKDVEATEASEKTNESSSSVTFVEEDTEKVNETKRDDIDHTDARVSMPSLMDGVSDDDDGTKDDEKGDSTNQEDDSIDENDTESTTTPKSDKESLRNKRRRRHTISHTGPNNPAAWDVFVRNGARLKSFIDNAVHKVASGHAAAKKKKSKRQLVDVNGDSPTQDSAIRRRMDHHTAQVAKEMTAEAMTLKMKLKEAEAEAAAMAATNATLREAAATSSERMERTVEALRIAGTNAINARADADAAEANAAALSNQLQALKAVVDETKRATQVLNTEHEHVSEATRSLESKVIQTESENGRMQKECRRLVNERDELLEKNISIATDRDDLQVKLKDALEQLDRMAQTAKEREAVEQARIDRSHQIEKELRETRTMLVEATATSADTETTTALLNDTIDELRKENKNLHERMESAQNAGRKEQERLSEALEKAECEAQELRIKTAADKDEMERLRLDRQSNDSHIAQLKQRINNLERKLKETAVPSESSPLTEKSKNGNQDESLPQKSPAPFSIPKLGTTPSKSSIGKENKGKKRTNGSSSSSKKCCLCYKGAFGLMKSCQCGKQSCDKRAHASCLANSTAHAPPSVSHPGTPAPRLPVVLCNNAEE